MSDLVLFENCSRQRDYNSVRTGWDSISFFLKPKRGRYRSKLKNSCIWNCFNRKRLRRAYDGSFSQEEKAVEEGPGPPIRNKSTNDVQRGNTFVELNKRAGSVLGLVLSGGLDKDKKPRVSYLRPGGIAQRSDALEVGDYIVSVNGIRTEMLRHDEIINVLKNANESVVLEVEYELPEPCESSFSVMCKRIEITLERDGNSFGFTLRGGIQQDPTKCRPLTVTQVRPGSSADREGTLKACDRILAINGVNVTQCTLDEALTLLSHANQSAVLLVEYDVSVMDAVQKASGPLLVEIEKIPGSSLGITLSTTVQKSRTVICIETIKPASIADRCGALHVGDQVLTIDDTSLEHMGVNEAMQLLKCCTGELTRLEILPMGPVRARMNLENSSRTTLMAPTRHYPQHLPVSASFNSFTSLHSQNSMTTNVGSAMGLPYGGTLDPAKTLSMRNKWLASARNHSASLSDGDGTNPSDEGIAPSVSLNDTHYSYPQTENLTDACALGVSYSGLLSSCNEMSHTESTEVTLVADHRGFGITLHAGILPNEILTDAPVISNIEHRSVAERSGILQIGDRVVSINGLPLINRLLDEANHMLLNSGMKITLAVEFDVAESVVPSSGTFNVKLSKKGTGLGITISSPSNRKPGDPLLISDVKKGSVAHRTGTIQPGDRLLEIDHCRMDSFSFEEAVRILQNTGEIVKLKIRKDETYSDEPDPMSSVTYTVELQKRGGPLGITISGTEEPFDPIFISGLTDGGLAEKTGALHVGDRILAINSKTLRGRPLSDAIQLLQSGGPTVTLKITRSTDPKNRNGVAGKSHDSVDSALESWDSSGFDHSSGRPSSGETQDNAPSKDAGSGSSHSSGRSDGTASAHSPRTTAYCDLDTELRIEEEDWDQFSVSDSVPLNPPSINNEDEWSRQMDELDRLGNLGHYSMSDVGAASDVGSRRSSDKNSSVSDVYSEQGGSRKAAGRTAGQFSKRQLSNLSEAAAGSLDSRRTDTNIGRNVSCGSLPRGKNADVEFYCQTPYSSGDLSNTSKVMSAELHLREVEEQLQNIFTPTPVELVKVTVIRVNESEDFGFSLSDGVYEKGVYISAIQPGGPADRAGVIRPFDRLLQVNDVKTKDLDCHQVVPLISICGRQMELVVSRNPLAEVEEDHAQEIGSVSDIWKLQGEDDIRIQSV